MKIKYWTLTALLIGCTSQPVAPSSPIHFTSEEIPYSGDAEMLLDLPYEEIIEALKKDYPNFDPLLVMETGDLEAFLEKYEGHVTEEDTADLLHRLYSMNDLMGEKKFLPKTSTDLSWDGQESCEEFLSKNLQTWPTSFTESTEPLFKKILKEGDDSEDEGDILEVSALTLPWDGDSSEEEDTRLKLTCHERWEGPGGTFNQENEYILYYNAGDELSEILSIDPEVDFTDSDIFKMTHVAEKTSWGARVIASQMTVPEILYFYDRE